MGISAVIGALRVVLGMDTAQFEEGADKGRRAASGLHGALNGIGTKFAALAGGAAVGTAAVTAFSVGMKLAADAAQYADDIAAQSYKLGVSAEYLQKFSHAAEASDVPAEAAKDALLGLSAAIGALQTRVGDGKIRKAMEALGISQEQIQSFRSAEDALPVLADKISKLGTVTEQLQFAKKFGIEALLPLLKQGADGIEGLMNNAEQLGMVLDESVINRLADMNERLRVADERAKMAGRGLGASFTPALVSAKEKMVDLVKWLDRAIDGFNTLADRSKDTLKDQIEQSKGWVAFYESKGNDRAAEKERARQSQLEEALRNSNRADLRRRAADDTSEPVATLAADYGGGGGHTTPSRAPSASDLAAARARAEGRVYGPSPEEMWGTPDWTSELDNKTVSIEDVLPLKEMRPAIASVTSDGSLEGQLDAMARARGQIREGWQYAIGDGLYAAIRGGGKGLMQWLAFQFQQSFVETLAKGLSKVLADVQGGSKGSGWASAASAVASMFGIGQNANGTPNWRGGLTWVGERGKELVNLPRGSQIVPNHALAGIGAGPQVIKVEVDKSDLWNVRVQQAAQPMVEQYSVAAAEGGATLAENNMATKRRTTLGSGRR